MNYNLAKKLKDAGFPQTFPDGRWYYDNNGELQCACEDHGLVHETQNHGIIPELSELIEACGDKFTSLLNGYKNGQPVSGSTIARWEAWAEYPKYHGVGNTPEEAVANLWLELQGK